MYGILAVFIGYCVILTIEIKKLQGNQDDLLETLELSVDKIEEIAKLSGSHHIALIKLLEEAISIVVETLIIFFYNSIIHIFK